MIERAFGFWKEHKSIIDFPTCLGDDYEWSTAEFREWRPSRDPCFLIDLSMPNSFDPWLPADIPRDYTLELEIRVESTLRVLRECPIKVIKDKDFCKEITNSLLEDLDKISRTYESELATPRAELEQRSLAPLSMEAECVQLRSWVTSLESELADITQRFTILGQTKDNKKAMVEGSRVKASKPDDLALRLFQVRFFTHSNLSLEYGLDDKPSEPKLAFHHL